MAPLSDRINELLDSWLASGTGSVVAVMDTAGEPERARMAGDLPIEDCQFLKTHLPPAALPAELLPALMPLTAANWALRQQTVSLALQDSIAPSCPLVCGWIWASADVAELHACFQASLLRMNPQGDRYIFRHYDPRVRACLHALLGPAWLQTVLPIAHNWLFIGRDRQSFVSIEPADTKHAQVSLPKPDRIHQVIERCGEINRALACAEQEGWRFEVGAYRSADRALQRCDTLGFTGESDRLAFMLHALTLSPDFDQHPDIARVLEAACAQGVTYIDAASRVPPQVWRAAAQQRERQS